VSGLPARNVVTQKANSLSRHHTMNILRSRFLSLAADNEAWKGEVVHGGDISGCSVQSVDGSITEWIITIDGVEADLGRFSEAIYKKLMQDAKQERFQGFRPGTVPPHLEPTYRAFSMDECARETVLEAMQQNNIRPFETARTDMKLENFSIPPAPKKSKKKKKSVVQDDATEEMPPQWRTFDTMKEAINAGWKPGQSFSFVATNVKGQKVKGESETAGAQPLGPNF